MLEQWTQEQWAKIMQQQQKSAFYLYTPMCGTCAVASKMMDVVQELTPHVNIGKANLNYMEQLAYELEIESVPCLIVAQDGKITNKIYAFQSVPYLYELLK